MVVTKTVSSLAEYFKEIEEFVKDVDTNETAIYFRGESDDFKTDALKPSIYRNNLIENEDVIYREVSRYNNIDFSEDKTTFDKLSRMQHYGAPTRLLDLSDDPLMALWFSKCSNQECKDACVYVLKIKKNEIKYSDSDTVTVLSNLAKISLNNKNNDNKRKKKLVNKISKYYLKSKIKKFNKKKCVKFLLHEIRNDINHFEPIINPKHLSSVICVKPKLSHSRVHGQKGAFLLFGLSLNDFTQSIPVFQKNNNSKMLELFEDEKHLIPVKSVLKLNVKLINRKTLENIGFIQPSIYPEMEKVSEYFKNKYSL
jgi:hypothetical protein